MLIAINIEVRIVPYYRYALGIWRSECDRVIEDV